MIPFSRFLKTAYLSFFSLPCYRMVFHAWKGLSLSYLFYLSMLTLLPMQIYLYSQGLMVNTSPDAPVKEGSLSYYIHQVIDQLPSIRFDGFTAHAATSPLTISDPASNRPLVHIDTDSATPELPTPHPLFVITQRHLGTLTGPHYQEHRWDTTLHRSNLQVGRADYYMLLADIQHLWRWYFWLLFPLFIGVFFAVSMVKIAFVALFTWGIPALIRRRTAGFACYFRLILLASTPACLIRALGYAMPHLRYIEPIALAITLVYIVIGLLAIYPLREAR